MSLDLQFNGQTVPLTSEQLEAFNRQGPRYTSYPTAPQWSNDFGPDQAVEALAASNQPGPDGAVAPVSLYMHLPFCDKLCLYCGCNVIIDPLRRRSGGYLDLLKRDIADLASRVDPARPVVQFHWGGGTPTYFSPDELADLFTFTRQRFSFADDAEIGVEIDPRVTTPEHLRTLRELGFNRLSMGIQDFDRQVQEAVARIQPYELVRDHFQTCRDLGFESLNADLIYGLPHQTPASFARTIDQLVGLAPDRIAMFSYGHVPWVMKHQRVLEGTIPLGEDKFQLFRVGLQRLCEAGMVYVGMDHFAVPGDELCHAQRAGTLHRNFQGYTTKAGADVLAAGVTGISGLDRAFIQNHRGLADYGRLVADGKRPVLRGMFLNDDDVLRRDVISELMCFGRVDFAKLGARHGVDFADYFAPELARLKELDAEGLSVTSADSVEATPLGHIFVRLLAMVFDAYLPAAGAASGPRYSQTI
ncbi:MAG: oxygen-independent coproporphyrinogen III oxidase [Propionibacteriaceae bacterium]|jgi:oxygen-independent coproporphyrinogen-3 oxidase|nr:oxygen-independent coproporphyrinogen III oxidase [Propionibacteriaceae bacterium]